jgi:hypothetical protein
VDIKRQFKPQLWAHARKVTQIKSWHSFCDDSQKLHKNQNKLRNEEANLHQLCDDDVQLYH